MAGGRVFGGMCISRAYVGVFRCGEEEEEEEEVTPDAKIIITFQ